MTGVFGGARRRGAGRYMRLVDHLVIHGEPLEFRALCGQVITPATRFLVLDLDRTFHLGRNLGELLGFELAAYQHYGPRYLELIERGDAIGPLVFDWRNPRATAAYLASGARQWALPGLTYLLWVKLGTRSDRTRRLLHERFGPDPVVAVQDLPRNVLLHALSETPADTLRMLARRVWRRHEGDQVITRGDLDWVRTRWPGIRVLISSASPQPVLEVAGEEMGADAVFFTSVEQRDGWFSAPPSLAGLMRRMPRRIAPPSRVHHNAGAAKLRKLVARFPEFGDASVETVGVTDTSYGEDHAWAQFFTRVVDINSPTPFSPIVEQGSPLREIHSAQVLTRGEVARRGSGEPRYLDPRRKHLPRRQTRRYDRQDLAGILAPVLESIEALAAAHDRERASLEQVLDGLEQRAAKVRLEMEHAVAEYNLSSGQARARALGRLQLHLMEDASLQRDKLRKVRPIATVSHVMTRLLQESRAALERPSQARALVLELSQRYAGRLASQLVLRTVAP